MCILCISHRHSQTGRYRLPQITAGLDLDQLQRNHTRILQPMGDPQAGYRWINFPTTEWLHDPLWHAPSILPIGAEPFRCGLIGYHLKLDSFLSWDRGPLHQNAQNDKIICLPFSQEIFNYPNIYFLNWVAVVSIPFFPLTFACDLARLQPVKIERRSRMRITSKGQATIP